MAHDPQAFDEVVLACLPGRSERSGWPVADSPYAFYRFRSCGKTNRASGKSLNRKRQAAHYAKRPKRVRLAS
jgi:hypothetical protein